MFGRLVEAGLSVLAAALAVYVAVHLIASVADELLVILGVVGGLVVTGAAARAWWRWRSVNRW